MSYLLLVSIFALACAITAAITPLVREKAYRYQWMDCPDDDRKRHERPTPTLGGLAIALGFGAGLSLLAVFGGGVGEIPLASITPWIGAAIMIGTGLYDDVKGVGFKAKFLLQVLAAYLILFAGYRLDLTMLPYMEHIDPYQHALISIPVTLLWIVGVINAVNLIDGLDGLAGGVVAIGFMAIGLVFGVHGDVASVAFSLAMAGALVGFLVHNFNPASIFMGDSGSLFLGYVLALFSLQGLNQIDAEPLLVLFVPVVALGLPLADAGLAIVRRSVGDRAICAPDDDHIHHRLTERFTVKQSVSILYGAALWCGLAALVMTLVPPIIGYGVFATTILAALAGLRMLDYLHPEVVIPFGSRQDQDQLSDDSHAPVRSASAADTTEMSFQHSGDGAGGEGGLVVEHRALSAADQ